MRVGYFALTLLAFAAPSAARADAATPEGAQGLVEAYEAYFGNTIVEKGVLTIAPQGESYLVTWDFLKLVDPAKMAAVRIEAAPITYLLTPATNGWSVVADKFPTLAIESLDDKSPFGVALAFDGFRLEAKLDRERPNFLTSNLRADAVRVKSRAPQHGLDQKFSVVASNIAMDAEARAAASGAGVDISFNHTIKSFLEDVATNVADGDSDLANLSLRESDLQTTGVIKGLRTEALGAMWRRLVAEGPGPDQASRIIGEVRGALPIYEAIEMSGRAGSIELKGARFEVGAKSIENAFKLTGVVNQGGGDFSTKITELSFRSELLPPWAAGLSPMSLDIKFGGSVFGLDEAARAALDDLQNKGGDELSPQTQERIATILRSGRPTATLAPGRLTLPFIDIAFEGQAHFDQAKPEGQFVVSVDSLDKTLDIVKSMAASEPQVASAIPAIALVKGMAATGEGGRLVWKFDFSAAGGLTVNGSPLPTGD